MRGSLDTCAQTVYTRAIESKGADGSNSASAFCVFGWISPSGEIEGPLREMHRSCVASGTGNGTRPQGAGALGVFILWFCWFGFNGGSSLSLSTDASMTMTGLVCFNTNLAAAVPPA